MALHSKKDFSEMCGMASNGLSVYVKRKKVILSGDFIDDSISQNREFLKKWQEKKGKTNQLEVKVDDKNKGEVKKPLPIKPDTPNVKEINKTTNGVSLYQLDGIKKALDIDKIQEEIEILKVKKEKLHGVLIPTDLVKILFAQHFKSVTTSFQHAADNLLMKISKKKDLNLNEMAELRGELIGIINIAINDSIDESKKNIKNIVNEYSEKRGIGERK